MRRGLRKKEVGFSLIELLAVAAVVLVVAAIVAPNIINAMHNVRLRSSANSVSGALQSARQLAVHDNAFYYICSDNSSGTTYVRTSSTTCTSPTPIGSRQQLGQNIDIATSGMPTGPTFTGFTPQAQDVPLAFNSRGLPCVIVSGSNCANNVYVGTAQQTVGFVRYLKDTRSNGSVGWAAVVVTPAGRVQLWQYDGSNWKH
jgi:Tfp pilus assembly protein FimT